ncbi:hypothetical protein [Flavobacterium sp. N502540]|uniref:hypothetical protein n=1 Tax=Flavobacterium sp. N502540 TaxID=2986838 RepID=UPI002224A3CC|nr:hypothetical protein [Flavobacterium sp. N502540]
MQKDGNMLKSGLVLGIIALIASVLAGASLIIYFYTFNTDLFVAIFFGMATFYLGAFATVLSGIGMNIAKKKNSSVLIPRISFILGVINVIIVMGHYCVFALSNMHLGK